MLVVADWLGQIAGVRAEPWLAALIGWNFIALAWRAAARFAFTAREYGRVEGLRALGRIPVANAVTILAGRRAFVAYVRTLCGQAPRWEKTFHDAHPAAAVLRGPAA